MNNCTEKNTRGGGGKTPIVSQKRLFRIIQGKLPWPKMRIFAKFVLIGFAVRWRFKKEKKKEEKEREKEEKYKGITTTTQNKWRVGHLPVTLSDICPCLKFQR